jgi:phosphotransferase system enzyme I (PtsI)
VKSRVLKSNIADLAPQVRKMLRLEEPAKIREQLDRLNGVASSLN